MPRKFPNKINSKRKKLIAGRVTSGKKPVLDSLLRGVQRISNKKLSLRPPVHARRLSGPSAASVENQMALSLIDALGYGISCLGTDYSFQTKSEPVDSNPNIFDKEKFNKLKNKLTQANDKFPRKEDPFYKADDEMPRPYKEQFEKLSSIFCNKYVVNIAADLISYNESVPPNARQKQLKD